MSRFLVCAALASAFVASFAQEQKPIGGTDTAFLAQANDMLLRSEGKTPVAKTSSCCAAKPAKAAKAKAMSCCAAKPAKAAKAMMCGGGKSCKAAKAKKTAIAK